MKKVALLIFFLITNVLFSQDKNLDSKLFGSWSGTEKDNQRVGMTKNWIMHRFEDGNFILLFTSVEDGEVSNFVEKGKWWVDENMVFNELHTTSGKTDTYTYIFINENNVKVKAKFLSVAHENKEYEFIDTKLQDNL